METLHGPGSRLSPGAQLRLQTPHRGSGPRSALGCLGAQRAGTACPTLCRALSGLRAGQPQACVLPAPAAPETPGADACAGSASHWGPDPEAFSDRSSCTRLS